VVSASFSIGSGLVRTAVIAFPSQIWSVGAQALLGSCGWEVVSRHATLLETVDAIAGRSVDLVVIAKSFLEGADGGRSLTATHSGKIAVVLEEGDTLSPDEFVDWKVEGLILGSASEVAFRECFADIQHDRCWVDPDVREVLDRDCATPSAPLLCSLSGREREVAQLAAEGLSNKQIARAMGVSDGTIKIHMHHVLTKFHMSSRIELVRLLGATGLDHGARPVGPDLRLIGG
jgi:two-component system nitrate/nitrite response regulator NarP